MIALPAAVRDRIVEAATEGAPEEVCGVLGGEFGADWSRVRSAYRATNVADEPRRRYRIDPEESLELFERIEDRDEAIVGFYHSHPRGPAEPSPVDREAAAWPDRSYLLVSLEPDAEVSSWRWRDGAFEREVLALE